MNNHLNNLCEQIQQDMLTYANSGLVSLSNENLVDLCEIVVQNFQRFDYSGGFREVSEEKDFLITNIEFEISESDVGRLESADEIQRELEKEWVGKILTSVLEEEIADVISDLSGWCILSIEYKEVV